MRSSILLASIGILGLAAPASAVRMVRKGKSRFGTQNKPIAEKSCGVLRARVKDGHKGRVIDTRRKGPVIDTKGREVITAKGPGGVVYGGRIGRLLAKRTPVALDMNNPLALDKNGAARNKEGEATQPQIRNGEYGMGTKSTREGGSINSPVAGDHNGPVSHGKTGHASTRAHGTTLGPARRRDGNAGSRAHGTTLGQRGKTNTATAREAAGGTDSGPARRREGNAGSRAHTDVR